MRVLNHPRPIYIQPFTSMIQWYNYVSWFFEVPWSTSSVIYIVSWYELRHSIRFDVCVYWHQRLVYMDIYVMSEHKYIISSKSLLANRWPQTRQRIAGFPDRGQIPHTLWGKYILDSGNLISTMYILSTLDSCWNIQTTMYIPSSLREKSHTHTPFMAKQQKHQVCQHGCSLIPGPTG